MWLDRRINVDLMLIHLITGLSMQGLDRQLFYPGKASDRSLEQRIKEAYDEVEKGKRGYKVSPIQDGAVCLAFQIIAGKKEPPHTGHRVRGGSHKKMSGGDADELGELPCQRA
jgi:hypothetical protein